jgi:hypothetical protein
MKAKRAGGMGQVEVLSSSSSYHKKKDIRKAYLK